MIVDQHGVKKGCDMNTAKFVSIAEGFLRESVIIREYNESDSFQLTFLFLRVLGQQVPRAATQNGP